MLKGQFTEDYVARLGGLTTQQLLITNGQSQRNHPHTWMKIRTTSRNTDYNGNFQCIRSTCYRHVTFCARYRIAFFWNWDNLLFLKLFGDGAMTSCYLNAAVRKVTTDLFHNKQSFVVLLMVPTKVLEVAFIFRYKGPVFIHSGHK